MSWSTCLRQNGVFRTPSQLWASLQQTFASNKFDSSYNRVAFPTLSFSTYTFDSSVGRDNVRDLIQPSIYHWLGDWIGIRGELIGCHGTNGALRWLPTASLAEISLFVESGKESYLNRKVGLVHSHLSLIIDDLASCSSKHPAYQFIILGARSFLSTLFFLCYSRNDVPKEIKVTRSQLWFFFPYRTFPKEISSWGGLPGDWEEDKMNLSPRLKRGTSRNSFWTCARKKASTFVKRRNG